MSPKQIDLVQASWTQLLPIRDTAADLFYGKLFELDPRLTGLFRGDMKEQGRKLTSMMGVFVAGLGRPATVAPMLHELGRKHGHYGVKESDYETVGIALIWALEQGLNGAFTVDVRNAWIETYAFFAEAMKQASSTNEPIVNFAG
jgi:hemoglobin-like flavoprotein